MKPLLAVLVPVVLLVAAAPAPAADAVPFAEQNLGMGYLIFHLSNINVVNGLNLSREQAVALRAIARRVEAASPAPPALEGTYRPDLAVVRDAYLEARRWLLAGEVVDEALRDRVIRARGTEAAVVRLSITEPDRARTGCARCHAEPETPDVRNLGNAAHACDVCQSVRSPGLKREIFLGHAEGLLGKRGLVTVALVAGQVDGILRPAQKDGLTDFSCCLLPPKDMSDPYRIGQAESGEEVVEMFRQVRDVPDLLWPLVRGRILDRLEGLAVVITPGANAARKAAIRQRAADLCDAARALSDVDFEIDRHRLAADLNRATQTDSPQTDRQRRFMAAFFLTVPGSVEAYDRLIARLDAERAAAP